jgi:hypothetical protein
MSEDLAMSQRNTRFAVAVGLSVCLVASTASAGITSLTPVLVDNRAGGAELADFVTNDVTIDFHGQYTGAQAWIQLTAGSIYQYPSPLGSVGPPNQISLEFAPALEFDTFVAQGSASLDGPFGNPTISLGAVDLGGSAVPVFDSTMINQSWFPPGGQVITDQTDFLIGRFTLSEDARGTARFLASAAGEIWIVPFDVVGGDLPGDFDNSGQVTQGDLDLVLLHWGKHVPPDPVPDGWINQQPMGLIGQSALDAVQLNWGHHIGFVPLGGILVSTASVPEPAAWVVLGEVIAILGACNNRRCKPHGTPT